MFSEAPSGSRLAYWKNGRSQQQQPNYYPEQVYFLSELLLQPFSSNFTIFEFFQNRGNIGFNQPQGNLFLFVFIF